MGEDVFDLLKPRLDSVNLSKCAFAARTEFLFVRSGRCPLDVTQTLPFTKEVVRLS